MRETLYQILGVQERGAKNNSPQLFILLSITIMLFIGIDYAFAGPYENAMEGAYDDGGYVGSGSASSFWGKLFIITIGTLIFLGASRRTKIIITVWLGGALLLGYMFGFGGGLIGFVALYFPALIFADKYEESISSERTREPQSTNRTQKDTPKSSKIENITKTDVSVPTKSAQHQTKHNANQRTPTIGNNQTKSSPPTSDHERFALGLKLIEGVVVEKNTALAASYFREAAENGHARSQCKLAELLIAGDGVWRNHDAAYLWLIKAENSGHSEAKILIHQLAQKGHSGSQQWVSEQPIIEARRQVQASLDAARRQAIIDNQTKALSAEAPLAIEFCPQCGAKNRVDPSKAYICKNCDKEVSSSKNEK